MTLDSDRVRARFPALTSGAVFFDNPGGTQVPDRVVDRMVDYLVRTNANHGGAFATSQESDAVIDQTRAALAALLGAARPEEIVFGPNMTTLAFGLSRALEAEVEAGDEIVVTRLDHDANITPWVRMAARRGARVRWVDFDPEDGTLRLEQLEQALGPRTRLVACGYASNALGTVNPVAEIAALARQAGALSFIDAVQYAPHGPIDVQALGCDFLAVSAYKFFGPHMGVLYGRHTLLERLQPDRVRPAPSQAPGKFETGTGNHEGIAGTLGALEYLAWVGETFGGAASDAGWRARLTRGLEAIRAHEAGLSRAVLERLQGIPGLRLWGPAEAEAVGRRVPTFGFTLEGHTPRAVAEALGREGLYLWDGNFYALAVTERLELEPSGGLVRAGLVHYNTVQEIDRLEQALRRLASGR